MSNTDITAKNLCETAAERRAEKEGRTEKSFNEQLEELFKTLEITAKAGFTEYKDSFYSPTPILRPVFFTEKRFLYFWRIRVHNPNPVFHRTKQILEEKGFTVNVKYDSTLWHYYVTISWDKQC